MKSEYKFLRTRDGVTSFAIVGVNSSPSDNWHISWNNQLSDLKKIFGDAVEEGVMFAVREYVKQEGHPQRIDVISLIHTASDTRSDAVASAAAVATWKSLGGFEHDIHIEFQDSRWMPFFEYIPAK